MKRCILYPLLSVVFTLSCVPIVPRVFHAPPFKEQGEMQVGGHISPNGFEAQYAYAILPKLFVTTDVSMGYRDLGKINSTGFFSASTGIGYYKAGKKNRTLALYANQSFIRANPNNSSSELLYYPAVGADIGFRKPKFEFVYSNRLNTYSSNKSSNFRWIGYETAVTLRFGRKTKFQFQVGSSFPLTNPNHALLIPFASAGLVCRLPSK